MLRTILKWGGAVLLILLILGTAGFAWNWFRPPPVLAPDGPGLRTAGPDEPPKEEPPSLDGALKIARAGLQQIRAEIRDYTAIMTKRERIGGQVYEQKMEMKIRNRRTIDGRDVPFSVYLKFLEPKSVAGREVIWIEGQNDGNLIAHETGIANLIRVPLKPTGVIAMMGNRYPITQIGLENLVVRLIAKGEKDKQFDDVTVEYFAGEEIGGRPCKLIQITHEKKKEGFDFRIAQIFIDREWNIPLRYAAFDFPEKEGDELKLIEQYTYEQVQLNVGLTDDDFDPDNEAYDYP